MRVYLDVYVDTHTHTHTHTHVAQADEVVSRVKALRRQSRELEEEIATIQMQALNAAGVCPNMSLICPNTS